MRILFLNRHARPSGGAERYVLETARLLEARGVETGLLYGVEGWTDPGYTGVFSSAFPMVDVARQIRRIRPDVVYVHQLGTESEMTPIRESGVPVARFFHDHRLFCPREHKYTTLGGRTCTRTVGIACYSCLGVLNKVPGRALPRLRTVRSVRAEQSASRGIAACVVGSRYMAGHLAEHGFDRARIHVNPLFATVPDVAPRVARDPVRLLFAGSLLRGKGLDLLLRALATLPPGVHLRVAGSGPQDEAALVRELGLQDRVAYLGQQSPDALRMEYLQAGCVVVPSRSPETFSLVGLEALASGAPVVAADVGGVREWMEHGVTGLLSPAGDVEALAQRIGWVLRHPGEAAAMGERGRARCRTAFSPEAHASRLVALFETLAGAPAQILAAAGAA